MLVNPFLSQRRLTTGGACLLLLFFVILILCQPTPRTFLSDHVSKWPLSRPSSSKTGDDETGPLPAPDDYSFAPQQSDFCRDRYSTKYLDAIRDRATQYCSGGSTSNLTCFHALVSEEEAEVDSLCIASGVAYDFPRGKFTVDCPLREIGENETAKGDMPFESIRSYWYETGPKYVFDNYVELNGSRESLPAQEGADSGSSMGRNLTILVKREGETNPWHCLMEIMTMTWTIDILRMARDTASGLPFFRYPDDVENTQIIILDDRVDGPYFDLWRLFSGKTPKRLKDLALEDGTSSSPPKPLDNVIIPLAGASNPLWQNDWEVRDCTRHQLLRTFTRRVLTWYDIPHNSQQSQTTDIQVTFVDRKSSRRLVNQAELLEAVRSEFPHVQVQAVDFAALPLRDQILVAQETDILVGVHGAGLTNLMFMRGGDDETGGVAGGGAIVEIQPTGLFHKGFRNLALMLGQDYFVGHAAMIDHTSDDEGKPKEEEVGEAVHDQADVLRERRKRGPVEERDGWHFADVEMDKTHFLHLMDVAIKSLYNKGFRSYDVI